HGQLRVDDACELTRQVAEGLQEAHCHGFIHRDIKPSNLMLSRPRSGQPALVKILDMGLARSLMESASEDLTSAHQIVGTLNYMAPEQAGSARHVDIRADIYSLGATLYQLLAGRPPLSHI